MAILALRQPNYKPAMRVIENITNANPLVVTTSFDHGYIDGLVVRLILPPKFQPQALNGQSGVITVIDETTFSMPLDSSNMDAYSEPNTFPADYQFAQVIPFAEVNSQLIGAVKNVLPYRN